MKKIIVNLLLLLTVTSFLYSQVTSGNESVEKKQEEKVFPKPPSYDSTKTLEEEYTPDKQYQFIGLQLILPTVINPEKGPVVFSKSGKGFGKKKKQYTIIDVLKGDDILEQLKQKNLKNQCGYDFKDFNSPQWKYQIIFAVFVLRDNNKKDSLNNAPLYWVVCQSKQAPYSCSDFNSFVSHPYFVKQKQLYQKQDVIKLDDKSKWLCKEVTLLKSWNNDCKDSTYDVFCLLKNKKGEQIQLRPPSEKLGRNFITEKEYIWLDHANRNQKNELIKAENDRQEKHKNECVTKFGQHFGELVAQTNIATGMNTEMCKAAWGAPWDIDKSKTLSKIKEVWFYNWNYKLYFENGVLIKIEH